MRPCEEHKPCIYETYDYSEDCVCCGVDFDGTDCPYIKPWGKQKYKRDHRAAEGGGMNIPTPSEPRKITITEICVYAVDENGEKHTIDITGFPTIHGTLDCETGTLILDPKEDA